MNNSYLIGEFHLMNTIYQGYYHYSDMHYVIALLVKVYLIFCKNIYTMSL